MSGSEVVHASVAVWSSVTLRCCMLSQFSFAMTPRNPHSDRAMALSLSNGMQSGSFHWIGERRGGGDQNKQLRQKRGGQQSILVSVVPRLVMITAMQRAPRDKTDHGTLRGKTLRARPARFPT